MITWNVLRAAGIGSYFMLFASVAWGLVASTEMVSRRIPKAASVALHQALSTAGVLLLAVHLGGLMMDKYMAFKPLDFVVPMRATYRPVGVTVGIIAMFAMILGVLATSWGRRLIGPKWWRRMHALAIPAFALALVHGLMTGTDAKRAPMWWSYVATASIVLFLLLVRAFTAGAGRKHASATGGGEPPAPTPAAERAARVDIARGRARATRFEGAPAPAEGTPPRSGPANGGAPEVPHVPVPITARATSHPLAGGKAPATRGAAPTHRPSDPAGGGNG